MKLLITLLFLGPFSPDSVGAADRHVSSTPAGELAYLQGLGFDEARATKLLASAPGFPGLYREWRAHGGGIPADGTKEVVTAYRGLRLASLHDFNPNYGLWGNNADSAQFSGHISVGLDRSLAAGYAAGSGDGKQGFLVTIQIPKPLLSPHMGEGIFMISDEDLAKVGIHDFSPFVVSVEAL